MNQKTEDLYGVHPSNDPESYKDQAAFAAHMAHYQNPALYQAFMNTYHRFSLKTWQNGCYGSPNSQCTPVRLYRSRPYNMNHNKHIDTLAAFKVFFGSHKLSEKFLNLKRAPNFFPTLPPATAAPSSYEKPDERYDQVRGPIKVLDDP